MKINNLDPKYMKGFNDGVKHGEEKSLDKIGVFINEKILTIDQVDGIGKKTAEKIHNHMLGRKEGEENDV